jgi:nuclear pore complex protein Nup205
VLATARTDRNRTASRFTSTLPSESEKPEREPRQNIAMLYTFIGLLFAALPEERVLQFWGSGPQGSFRPTYQESVESISGRLPAWAVWSTVTPTTYVCNKH